jgi:hypothetical protein
MAKPLDLLYKEMENTRFEYLKAKKMFYLHNRDPKHNWKLCFWTHPWGHLWYEWPDLLGKTCVICGKDQFECLEN